MVEWGMAESIIKLSEKTTASDLWTVKEMLEAAIEKVDSRPGKALIIYIDDKDGVYHTSVSSAGFHKTSEIVCLLEVLKMQTIANDMNCL